MFTPNEDCVRPNISESGILAASIEQSRRRWTIDGIFEKYWAKPSKKKSQDAQNPSKDSMSRLGVCSLVIEPHVFEVTLYTVREPQVSYNAPIPTAPPRPSAPYTQPTSGTPNGYSHSHPQASTPQHTLPPFREGFAQYDPHGPSNTYRPPYSAPIAHPGAASQSTAVSPSGAGEANGVQLHSPKPSPDPVIQMLATRAASDHNLKSLMKVVASGRASQSQLREFQNHIDDLNAEIKAGRGVPPLSPHDSVFPRPLPPNGPDLAPGSTPGFARPQVAVTTSNSAYSQPAPVKVENQSRIYSQYQQPVKPKNVVQYKSEVSSIVFDFSGTGDRFSFPRFSILEYLPGGNQVIASFLVIRKGDASLPGNYKENMSYYQPVTMRLSTLQPRTLEPLAKVVAPAEEVRRYMDSVFDKMSPVENTFLATRLPRAIKEDSVATKEQTLLTDEPVARACYPPPTSLVPWAA